jgi:hypothetical protein
MNTIVVSLAWCWMQTLVVAGLSIGLSRLATRRSPAPFGMSKRRTCLPLSSLIVITSFASPATSCLRLNVNTAPYGGFGAVQLPAMAPMPAAPAGC